jgi:hypothetical protein
MALQTTTIRTTVMAMATFPCMVMIGEMGSDECDIVSGFAPVRDCGGGFDDESAWGTAGSRDYDENLDDPEAFCQLVKCLEVIVCLAIGWLWLFVDRRRGDMSRLRARLYTNKPE